MDIVLVGLPGSGKTEVGRRLAARSGGTFIDTDREIERAAGRSIEAIFRSDGEAGFRALERATIEALGPAAADAPGAGDHAAARVIATGAGAVVDPRNRWRLADGRRAFWLDAPGARLAERLERSPTVRPLLAEGDLATGLERLRHHRERFYAAAERVDADGPPGVAVEAIEERLRGGHMAGGVTLLRAGLAIGRVVLGVGVAAAEIDAELRRAGARRAVIVTEPGARAAVGRGLEAALASRGWTLEVVELPQGEAAKRLSIIETAAGELARVRVERDEPIVAIGGGALTDAAGFLAATYQRGIPWLAVPTTMLGQLDAALGGKTAVDIDAGKNLVGAFHLPSAVIVDPDLLAPLPVRDRRAGLAEAVKDGVLGDERLLEVLQADGAAIAAGHRTAEPSALAEVIERAAWLKLSLVESDPLERGDRMALNLGHTLGHAIEAAAGFGPLLHGEAVAYGLRAAARLGVRLGSTPAERAERIESMLDTLSLAIDPLPYPLDEVLDVLATDKKRRGGVLRWVLPTAGAWTVADGVPEALVREVASGVLAGRPVDAAARP
ncbi:MAG: bifunctional shikimate kinase/3-dehydroquinate synthase [Chloroflexi bacterium]|nr:bifunctional shikimate kinase/3-dehydroquinate synthase [Chloroflexota bacterium]